MNKSVAMTLVTGQLPRRQRPLILTVATRNSFGLVSVCLYTLCVLPCGWAAWLPVKRLLCISSKTQTDQETQDWKKNTQAQILLEFSLMFKKGSRIPWKWCRYSLSRSKRKWNTHTLIWTMKPQGRCMLWLSSTCHKYDNVQYVRNGHLSKSNSWVAHYQSNNYLLLTVASC